VKFPFFYSYCSKNGEIPSQNVSTFSKGKGKYFVASEDVTVR